MADNLEDNNIIVDTPNGKQLAQAVYDLNAKQYELPQATSSALGGIKADEKTENETAEVKIDTTTGKLFAPTPYELPQATSAALGGIKADEKTENETAEVKIDTATGKLFAPAGSSGPTLTWHTGETGATLTAAETEGKTLVKVYKNGILLQEGSGNDYTISGTVITFETALVTTDKITTEVY